jgi:hypothetical protein
VIVIYYTSSCSYLCFTGTSQRDDEMNPPPYL